YGATRQNSNAYGSSGSSTFSKNGQTVDTQHYSGAGGNFATAESSNGNRYAAANGNVYRDTGSGVQKDTDGSWNNVQKPSDGSRGWGGGSSGFSDHSGSSAFSGWGSHSGDGGGGWGSRASSSRGWASRGGGGGWGGGGFGGRGFRR